MSIPHLPARSAVAADGTVTVRWVDLRFSRELRPPARAPNPFGATIIVTADGSVVSQRLGGD